VHCSGAYGLTASPVDFISHEPPREFAAEGGAVRDITDARIGVA
jgi:diaminopimelate decarboxylase